MGYHFVHATAGKGYRSLYRSGTPYICHLYRHPAGKWRADSGQLLAELWGVRPVWRTYLVTAPTSRGEAVDAVVSSFEWLPFSVVWAKGSGTTVIALVRHPFGPDTPPPLALEVPGCEST